MSKNPTIIWYRHDLRMTDHAALQEAIKKGDPIIPLYIWSPEEEGHWAYGGATKWWLHYSLESLRNDLEERGLKLIIRKGRAVDVLKKLIKETDANAVFWHRRYEPYAIARDTNVKSELHHIGIAAQSFNGSLLFEPWTIANNQKKPFQVFTPFWKNCLTQKSPQEPLPAPKTTLPGVNGLESIDLKKLELLPKIHWDTGLDEEWTPGCEGAKKRLNEFLKEPIVDYIEQRDLPHLHGTSKISPHLHFGELSPRMVWHAVINKYKQHEKGAEGYLRQIGWREFAHHLIYHFPQTPEKPLRVEFGKFPWNKNEKHLMAWQNGKTGYPIVDAGMRELWHTGWMHNRVRLITGSFLIKDLLLPWQEGEKWFWDTLVDADLANNTMGWQWVGGCGADAAPYFRIFNPILQGEKFDPEGEYVKKWVPELKKMPSKWIHKPWEAPQEVLKLADLTLGENYPEPLVDHDKARKKALEAFAEIRSS